MAGLTADVIVCISAMDMDFSPEVWDWISEQESLE